MFSYLESCENSLDRIEIYILDFGGLENPPSFSGRNEHLLENFFSSKDWSRCTVRKCWCSTLSGVS